MVAPDTLVLFTSASVALALAPGPDNIFVLTQSAMYGRKAGLLITAGICCGLIVHILVVTLGVAVLFQTSVTAFTTLKALGAAYLLYLAWQAFRSATTDTGRSGNKRLGDMQLFTRGVILNVTNPKVVIFFLAFLPQFADPSTGPLSWQLMVLGMIFMACAALVFSLFAWGGGYLADWLKRSRRAQLMMNRLAGLVFVGLALRLACTDQ
ncbi:MAG: threonine transporter RhtB [Proteobacteria bacterium]|nr:MAG: threonine transporter RhtB [Pseudomonadota bacterium]